MSNLPGPGDCPPPEPTEREELLDEVERQWDELLDIQNCEELYIAIHDIAASTIDNTVKFQSLLSKLVAAGESAVTPNLSHAANNLCEFLRSEIMAKIESDLSA